MSDITKIPTEELLKDLMESSADVAICDVCLVNDITTYSGGNVQDRKAANLGFIEKINAELKRRQEEEKTHG